MHDNAHLPTFICIVIVIYIYKSKNIASIFLVSSMTHQTKKKETTTSPALRHFPGLPTFSFFTLMDIQSSPTAQAPEARWVQQQRIMDLVPGKKKK